MSKDIVSIERIAQSVFHMGGQRVMLAFDLVGLHGVAAKILSQAVKREAEPFLDDFMFRLTSETVSILRSQLVTSRLQAAGDQLVRTTWSQFVTRSKRSEMGLSSCPLS
jgi:ORF6N domain